jgi:hypothetical protein
MHERNRITLDFELAMSELDSLLRRQMISGGPASQSAVEA